MGDRTIPWDEDEQCGVCGELGAFDVMGDYICMHCFIDIEKRYDGNETDAQED